MSRIAGLADVSRKVRQAVAHVALERVSYLFVQFNGQRGLQASRLPHRIAARRRLHALSLPYRLKYSSFVMMGRLTTTGSNDARFSLQ